MLAFGPGDERGAGGCARTGGVDDRLLRRGREPSGSSAPQDVDGDIAQELVETLYHVLWELVHVFFEHRGLLAGLRAHADTTPARPRSCIRSWMSARRTWKRSSRTCASRC